MKMDGLNKHGKRTRTTDMQHRVNDVMIRVNGAVHSFRDGRRAHRHKHIYLTFVLITHVNGAVYYCRDGRNAHRHTPPSLRESVHVMARKEVRNNIVLASLVLHSKLVGLQRQVPTGNP